MTKKHIKRYTILVIIREIKHGEILPNIMLDTIIPSHPISGIGENVEIGTPCID
jgi:hypothetical protein